MRLWCLWLCCTLLCAQSSAHANPETITGCDQDATALLVAQPLRFEPGTATILGDNEATLDTLAELAVLCSQARIIVEGHTDSMGGDAINLALSKQRASAVGKALHDRGISSDRISSEGYGASKPIADNATRAGRKLNRRVTVRFVPRQES